MPQNGGFEQGSQLQAGFETGKIQNSFIEIVELFSPRGYIEEEV
jgi:hypothetical protein